MPLRASKKPLQLKLISHFFSSQSRKITFFYTSFRWLKFTRLFSLKRPSKSSFAPFHQITFDYTGFLTWVRPGNPQEHESAQLAEISTSISTRTTSPTKFLQQRRPTQNYCGNCLTRFEFPISLTFTHTQAWTPMNDAYYMVLLTRQCASPGCLVWPNPSLICLLMPVKSLCTTNYPPSSSTFSDWKPNGDTSDRLEEERELGAQARLRGQGRDLSTPKTRPHALMP